MKKIEKPKKLELGKRTVKNLAVRTDVRAGFPLGSKMNCPPSTGGFCP